MKLKIRKLHPSAKIPTKAHESDVGYDLVATESSVVNEKDHGYIEYKFGISVKPSPGFYCEIVPRSSISKTGLWLANGLGVIDPEYTGELVARFKWIPKTKKYEVGERVAQLIIRPIIETEIEEEMGEFEETARGEGGFGSTGEK